MVEDFIQHQRSCRFASLAMTMLTTFSTSLTSKKRGRQTTLKISREPSCWRNINALVHTKTARRGISAFAGSSCARQGLGLQGLILCGRGLQHDISMFLGESCLSQAMSPGITLSFEALPVVVDPAIPLHIAVLRGPACAKEFGPREGLVMKEWDVTTALRHDVL